MITGGKLGQILGRKRAFAIGCVIYGCGSFTTSIAPNLPVLLFGWSVAFFYHLCNGIRHLAWDAGYGFEIGTAARSGYAVLAATVLLTAITWLYVFLV